MWRSRAVALVVAITLSAFAQKRPCSEAEARQADAAVDTLHSWDGLYQWYKRYRQCDDGGTAEGVSEAVARNLVDRWKSLPRLAELGTKDEAFRKFVVRHLDETLGADDLRKIREYAEKRCPDRLHQLCHALRKGAQPE